MRILLHMVRKEFLQLRQDRRMIPMLIGAPLLQLVIFGFAANLDVAHIRMLLVDRDRTAASRELVDRFTSSRYFDLVGDTQNPVQIDHWLEQGRAQVALVIGEGYQRDLASGRTASVQMIADGTEANSAVVGLGYASIIISTKSGEVLRERLQEALRRIGATTAAGTIPPQARIGSTVLLPRILYNPDLRSRWFYVPAILAQVMMLMTMILPSMAVVREKEIGTLEQIIVTPIRPWQLMVGKLLPFALIGLADTLLVTGMAVFIFHLPLRGSLLLLLLLTLLFIQSTLGLGLLVSTVVRNQQQAMMASIFLLMLPMIYLSGLIFPIENMPKLIRYGTYGIPLRYYNIIIRGIFLKGSGLGTLWREALILLGYGVLILGAASRRFRKRLD
jgi:ABC-2 type transport system permease protein